MQWHHAARDWGARDLKGHTVRGEQPLRAFMALSDAADPLLRKSAPSYVF